MREQVPHSVVQYCIIHFSHMHYAPIGDIMKKYRYVMFMTLYAGLYTIFNIWCPLKSKSFLAAFSVQLDIFMMMGAETVLQFFLCLKITGIL